MLEHSLHVQPWTASQLRDTLILPNHHAWVAVGPDDIPTGYLIAMASPDAIDVLTIGIDPAHQRQGQATELLNTLAQFANKIQCATIFLEVRESNAAARACYQRAGFQETGKRRDYYPHGHGREDAVVMTWRIK